MRFAPCSLSYTYVPRCQPFPLADAAINILWSYSFRRESTENVWNLEFYNGCCLRNVTLSSLLGIYWHFGETCCLFLRVPETGYITENSNVYIINVQRDATICSLYFILLQEHSTCFGCLSNPSSWVHKTVVTATGISHIPRRIWKAW